MREELVLLENDQRIKRLRSDRAEEEYTEAGHCKRKRRERDARRKDLDKANDMVSRKETEISRMNVAPEPIMQPLPQDAGPAFRWLFFLNMPDDLGTLATLSFTGQQMLMPKRVLLDSQPDVYKCNGRSFIDRVSKNIEQDSIVEYHNAKKQIATYCASESDPCTEREVRLRTFLPFISFQPSFAKRVDNIQELNDGVWSPDAVSPRMGWDGGKNEWDQYGKEVDPFSVDRKDSILFYTELLNEPSLKWAMKQDASMDETRGNLALSSQSLKPDCLSQNEYYLFCRLRAFPLRQIRDIIACIGDQSLPLPDEDVQKLIFQAIFHVGSLSRSDDESQSFLWKQDLYDSSDTGLVSNAGAIFKNVGNVLRETPSNAASTYVIAALCNFLSRWRESMKDISRDLGDALCLWASDIDNRVRNSTRKEDVSGLKVKQSELLRRSILCFAGGPLTDGDIEKIVVNIVECNNLCLGHMSSENRFVSECLSIVASRLHEIVECIERRPEMLTFALRKIVVGAPDCLEWRSINDSTSFSTASVCYEAENDGCLYGVNILTGVVLVNGLPPGSLPAEILDHSLYKRVFGKENFEVVNMTGVQETTKLVSGCMYRFLRRGQELHVTEIDVSTMEEHELLDATTINSWAGELKPRLQQMHSHWLNRQQDIIVLRGRAFYDRQISFLLSCGRESSSLEDKIEVGVHVVPKHLRSIPLSELLDQMTDFERIIVPAAEVSAAHVLTKFENPDFIHFVGGPLGLIRIELPRFGLSFDFKGGRFICQELRGFCLWEEQLLCGAMHGFCRYIILNEASPLRQETSLMKWSEGDFRVIIPDGEVVREEDGHVTVVDRSLSNGAHCKWYQYKVHQRYGTLCGGDTAGRIHLASIHIATSMAIPDSMIGMTGAERAMELIRECWTTKPYSYEERRAFENVMFLSRGRYPNIFLLCLDNLKCSEQVSFLYEQMDEEEYEPRSFRDIANTNDFVALIHDCNVRMGLSSDEMGRLGLKCSSSPVIQGLMPENLVRGLSNSTKKKVATLENSFLKCLDHEKTAVVENAFPLSHVKTDCRLGMDVMEEMRASWNNYTNGSREKLVLQDSWFQRVSKTAVNIDTETARIWAFLKQSLQVTVPRHFRNRMAFHQLTNILPALVTPMDLIRGVHDPTRLSAFNPSLSEASQKLLKDVIVAWLRLLVLADKTKRLKAFHSQNNVYEIRKELRCSRLWNPWQYPAWVAFEVDQGIQIRPEQAEVALHLLRNSGHVVQMNMGMGKTSKCIVTESCCTSSFCCLKLLII